MIQITFKGFDVEYTFPSVTKEMRTVSLTDYDKSGIRLLIVQADGKILVSKAGVSVEAGPYRGIATNKDNLVLEKQLLPCEKYERDFTTRYGKGKLYFEYIKD